MPKQLADAVTVRLSSAELVVLGELLAGVLPYPPDENGPQVSDTVAFVQRRLGAEDAAWAAPLRAGLADAAGREQDWLAQAAYAVDQSAVLFAQLRGWAWDGFLADPRWGVNRGGRGWAHFGWAGSPRSREQ